MSSLTIASAGTDPGDVVGTLTVETQRALVLVNAQDYGSEQLGPIIISARGEFYGLTGLSDRTVIGYSNSTDLNEIRVAQARA